MTDPSALKHRRREVDAPDDLARSVVGTVRWVCSRQG